MIKHIRRRGTLTQRFDVDVRWIRPLRQRLAAWVCDPKTTIAQLRAALAEVLESQPRAEWDSMAVKIGYLELIDLLAQPIDSSTRQEIEGEYTWHLGDMQLSPEMVRFIEAARRVLLREPERSRRVLRLLCANWLAHVENPELRPRKPAVRALLPLQTSTNPVRFGTISIPIYPVNADAPAGARALPPPSLASWLLATDDARLRILLANFLGWPWPPDRAIDRKAHSDLVIMLAKEIYHRDRGSPAPSDESLVGTYLKGLPDDGSAEVDDGSATTVPR